MQKSAAGKFHDAPSTVFCTGYAGKVRTIQARSVNTLRSFHRSEKGMFLLGARGQRRTQPAISWHAFHTFSGVAGIWIDLPLPGMASANAFITAAIAAVVPASPAPLTPSGLVVAGTSWTSSLNIGK